jgi:two-component SAPR family response regulator
MIVIFSDDNYIEFALKSFPIYIKFGISTTNNQLFIPSEKHLLIIDKELPKHTNFSAAIQISNKKHSDLKKPFHISLLTNLINQRLQSLSTYVLPKKFSFFLNKRLLLNTKNKFLNLTEKESNLLAYLIKNTNNFIDKATILHDIWQYDNCIETTTLETHIFHLKTKLQKLHIYDVIEMQKDKIRIINEVTSKN